MYDRRICTGDKKQINDALESMPSGHSTAAFAGLIFLSLYLNAQLKVMSAHNPAYWKMVLFFAPILGAVLIAGALTIDECQSKLLLPLHPSGSWLTILLPDSPQLVRRCRRRHNWVHHCLRCFPSNLCRCVRLQIQPSPSTTYFLHFPPHTILRQRVIKSILHLSQWCRDGFGRRPVEWRALAIH